MCGITGYLTTRGDPESVLRQDATRMCDGIAHRGPDDQGLWLDAPNGVVLGHRRLAIVDLSPQGHQPMASACGRYMVVYNGEIYNHMALRQQLGNVAWRGHSDTETMLACFTRFGVRATLDMLVGMFAFAVWDHQTRSLILARDRMGEKPLYYGRLPCGDFVFGSELKALRAHPRWQAEIDRDSLALYMRHNNVPAPRSIYKGIAKLRPGSWLEVSAGGEVREGLYWRMQDVVERARAQRLEVPDAEAIDQLEAVLSQAVKDQMVADVPLGAFLSGGVDSSAIVALMCKQSSNAVRTFSIGFAEEGFNEAEHAKAVAAHLGTDHTELYVTAQDALAVVPRLPRMYDEPFADSSQIPTYLVSQMARRHVTVSLSGDAGDELFAGYNRYLLAERLWNSLSSVPLGLRRVTARAILGVSPGAWDSVTGLAAKGVPALRRHARIGDKLHKLAANVMPVATREAMYRSLVSHWHEPASLVLGSSEPKTLLDEIALELPGTSSVEQMCLLDQVTYLPDDILVKVDRAAMAVSLETRVPLLDHRVVEFAWRLPMHQKIRGGSTKWLLRQMLYRHVPRELIERPKQGFAVPIDHWLRGPLREWAHGLLNPARLRAEGFFDAAMVERCWNEHQQGQRNWEHRLWGVLMFQAWHEEQRAGEAAAA
jgi:asparagine synthase (glutamine-hydrolysing)